MELIRRLYRHRSSPIRARLLKTTFWSAVGEGASKGLLLVATVLLARILGSEDYGQFGLVRTTINMFAVVGGLGLGLTANRYVAQFRDTDKAFSGQIIGSSYLVAACTGTLAGAAMFVGADPLASKVLGEPGIAEGLKVAALLLMLLALSGAQVGVLQGLESYRALATGWSVQGVAALLFLVTGGYYFGLNGALVGLVAYTLVGVVAFQLLTNREMAKQGIQFRFDSTKPMLPILWRFSLPATLMGIAVAPFKWVTEASLAGGSGFGELGVFHGAMIVANIILALVSTVNSPLISLAANLKEAGRTARLQYLNLYGSWYLFLPLALPFVAFPELASVLLGGGYSGAGFLTVTLLLILYSGLMTYYQGVMRLVTQYGSLWFGLFTNVCEGVALLAAFLYLRDWGAVGLGTAYVLSYVVRILVTTPFLIRYRIATSAMLLDRYFLATVLGMGATATVQIGRL